jgi:F-type H+-transporting ATPase subunit alpha
MIRSFTSLYRRAFQTVPTLHFSKKLGIGEASAVLEEKIKNISQVVHIVAYWVFRTTSRSSEL